MFRRGGTKRPRFSVGGHTIFELDDSSNHSGLGIIDYEDESSSQHQMNSTHSSDPNSLFSPFAPDRPRRAHKSFTKLSTEDNTNLNACLDHLLRTLSRKDKEGFFQFPVTDQVTLPQSRISHSGFSFRHLDRSRLFSDHRSTNGFFHDEKKNPTR